MPPHVVLHCTAYDAVPSGARRRAVGLAAAFLRAGCRVTALSPRGLAMRPLVEAEAGGRVDESLWTEVATGLRADRPWLRAVRAPGVVERATPADADVFVTDYQPVLDRVPTALTVHDLRYVVAARGESRARALAFRAVFPGLARRARWIVVPSAAVGDECVRRAGVPREKVVVVPNAPDAVWRRAAPVAGAGRHLLVVGIAEPRKHFAPLVAAFRRARRRGAALPLVAVGRGSSSAATVLRGARDLVAAGALRWVGTPTDAELVEWMRDAAALLHPSVYEGFGLPVLEAFACGVPVIARPGAAVEEVGGPLLRCVEGDDAEGWTEAILAACSATWDRTAGSDARRARAAEFTWDASAASFLRAVVRPHS